MAKSVQDQTHGLFAFVRHFLTSSDIWFQANPKSDPRTDPTYQEFVKTFRTNTGNLIDIRFVSKEGGLYYGGNAANKALADVSDRDYFQAQQNPDTRGFFMAKPVLSRVTKVWGLPISYPMQARPQGIAVIFAAIENRILSAPLEAARTKPDGSIAIVHRNGTVLFRTPDNDSIGKSMSQGLLWTRELPNSPEGSYETDAGLFDGLARVVSYVSDPDFSIVVVATSSRDAVLAQWAERTKWLVAGGVFMTIFTVIILRHLLSNILALDAMRKAMQEQAQIDYLTGTQNRRYFMDRGRQEMLRSRRYGRPMALLMFDLDKFKNVNDRYGHETGDRVLQGSSGVAKQGLRDADFLGRLGGEEFAIVLPETKLEQAREVAERLRQRIETLKMHSTDGQLISVTVSVGVAALDDSDTGLEALIARADKALYAAKNNGRNRVEVAQMTFVSHP